ncbi:hypothetical protein B0H11DRAFT_1287046 [Mycena galericulata]|nr:hypothetical protein B0H11DRAFT_1287046 [Mycena galericulata]
MTTMAFAPDIEAVRLNKEAGEFFRCGQYGAAVQCYKAAIIADTSESPLYFSNLAAAYLKLGQFESAQSAAHTALQRDPKSVKARYRRALARRESGQIAEALMDLATLLSIHPDHKEGSSAFANFLAAHAAAGSKQLSPDEIVAADSPHAFGHFVKPSNQNGSTVRVNISAAYPSIPRQCVCDSCKARKDRSEMKTCSKVRFIISVTIANALYFSVSACALL